MTQPKPNTMDDWIDKLLLGHSNWVDSQHIYSNNGSYRLSTDEAKALITAKLKEVDGCPCLLVKPCSSNCSCANSVMSGGCMRCCKYGSKEQRIKAAQRLVEVDIAARISELERTPNHTAINLYVRDRLAELKREQNDATKS